MTHKKEILLIYGSSQMEPTVTFMLQLQLLRKSSKLCVYESNPESRRCDVCRFWSTARLLTGFLCRHWSSGGLGGTTGRRSESTSPSTSSSTWSRTAAGSPRPEACPARAPAARAPRARRVPSTSSTTSQLW